MLHFGEHFGRSNIWHDVLRWAGQLLVVALHGVVLTNGQGDHLKTLQCIVMMFGDDDSDDMVKAMTVYET